MTKTGRESFIKLKKICPPECKSPEDVYNFLEGTELNNEEYRMLVSMCRHYSYDEVFDGDDGWYSNWKDF